MKNKYIFLRHGKTIKNPSKNSREWSITNDALEIIKEYIKDNFFSGVTCIISSEEDKAYTTGIPIAKINNLEIIRMSEFNEINRSDKFLTSEDFLIQKKKQLDNLSIEIDGGESGQNALNRFKLGIAKLESKYKNKTILIITHGTVLSLYFAELLNQTSDTFNRWQKLKFCALGKVENNIVIKDIV